MAQNNRAAARERRLVVAGLSGCRSPRAPPFHHDGGLIRPPKLQRRQANSGGATVRRNAIRRGARFHCEWVDLTRHGGRQGRTRRREWHPSRGRRARGLEEAETDGHDRRRARLHGRLRGPGIPHLDGAPSPDVPGARLHHGPGAGHHSRHWRTDRNGDAAAVHLQHGSLCGLRAPARSRRNDRHRRSDSGDPVRRARRCRLRRHGARRLPDGEEG